MSILTGADPTRIAQTVFAGTPPVDPESFPNRFRVEDINHPHTIQDTLAYTNAMAGTSQFPAWDAATDYILAFIEASPLLHALDERLDPIQAPGQLYSGTTYPEIVCALVRKMSTEYDPNMRWRSEVLLRTLSQSQTFRANLNGYGYTGMKSGEPGAVWAVRSALSALGGMPAAFYPDILDEFKTRLGRAFPEHKDAIHRMAHDYRYVTPSLHRPDPAVA